MVALALWIVAALPAAAQHKSADSELLGKALDYFAAGKYGEALNLFVPLDKQYTLNDRFRAYIGVCYYYEWDFKEACRYLDEVTPAMAVYAPHERNVYYFAAAESHFNLGEYAKAIPYYEQQLGVCYDSEKGDALYRLGFCYLFLDDAAEAYGYFSSALAYYERYRNTADMAARMTQIRTMLPAIERRVEDR